MRENAFLKSDKNETLVPHVPMLLNLYTGKTNK
jgi:hypothetical protein